MWEPSDMLKRSSKEKKIYWQTWMKKEKEGNTKYSQRDFELSGQPESKKKNRKTRVLFWRPESVEKEKFASSTFSTKWYFLLCDI